jgi:hypothetical protein
MSLHHTVGYRHDMRIVVRSFENVAKYRHWRMLITNQNIDS